jgi:ATP-binding cassette subfamily B protein
MANSARRLLERFPALERLGRSRARRLRFVRQLADTECGAACLAMVLGYHGRDVSLEQMRDVCGTGRDGVNGSKLLDAAALVGLRGRGVQADIHQLDLLAPGSTILHWEFRHFVVLAKAHPRFVDIVDPAVGPRTIPMEEFRRAFTGVALVFEPGEGFRRGTRRATLYGTLKQLILESGLLRRIAILSLALQIFGLIVPALTGQVVDRVLPRGDLGFLGILLWGLALVVVCQGAGEVVRGHLLMHLRTLLDAQLTLGFLDHLVSLPFAFFQVRTAGDLMMRLNSNTIVRERLTSTAFSALFDGVMIVLYLAILLLGNGMIAAVTVAVGLLDVAIFCIGRRKQRDLTGQTLAAQARSQSYQVEMLTAIETLKASGFEHRAVAHWAGLFVDQLNVQLQGDRLSIKMDTAVSSLRLAGPMLVLAAGAREVLAGRLSLGAMLALCAVAAGFLQPLSSLVQALLGLETVRAYLDRVTDVLQAAPEQAGEQLPPAHQLAGRVTIEAVTFRYGADAAPAVKEVDLDIPAGKFVAVVGKSGSGKSTLAALILGLRHPTVGRILFDGVDLQRLDLRSVRQQMGVVSQSLSLFGMTIRENIALTDPTLSLSDIESAARLACVHEDVMAQPLGYNTPLLDRGGALSGGQRQRLALARALVRRPAILVLDEATSALDASTEREVQLSLAGLSCTRIVIAHRLSTIRQADLIVVMENGRIAEAGTHGDLYARNGVYTRLIAAQMAPPDDNVGAAWRAHA